MNDDFTNKEEFTKAPSYLAAVLNNKCPRCRHGDIFKTKNPYALKNNAFMQMHDKCPVCRQPTDLEVGFYYGTSYVSYALGVAFSVATFIAWWMLIGVSIYDNRLFWWLGIDIVLLIVLQPVFMRLSRSLWLSWYVKYNPNWKTENPKNYERFYEDMKDAW